MAMRDFEVDQLIEDERKSELPRLDQLKVREFCDCMYSCRDACVTRHPDTRELSSIYWDVCM